MIKRPRGWELIKADRLMLAVAAGLALVLVINQVLDVRARHRDSIRQADMYSLQLAVQKFYALNGFYPASLSDIGVPNKLCNDPKFGGDCSNSGYTYRPLSQDGKSLCDNHRIICRGYQLSSDRMETTSSLTLSSD